MSLNRVLLIGSAHSLLLPGPRCRSPTEGSSRREALRVAASWGLGAAVAATPLGAAQAVTNRKAQMTPAELQESLVLILRVKEATEQESRLIKSGK